MSSVPFFEAGEYQIWLAGHSAYRLQAKQLFEKLAAGLAERSGAGSEWEKIRAIVTGR